LLDHPLQSSRDAAHLESRVLQHVRHTRRSLVPRPGLEDDGEGGSVGAILDGGDFEVGRELADGDRRRGRSTREEGSRGARGDSSEESGEHVGPRADLDDEPKEEGGSGGRWEGSSLEKAGNLSLDRHVVNVCAKKR
jgi:hypothetical protein